MREGLELVKAYGPSATSVCTGWKPTFSPITAAPSPWSSQCGFVREGLSPGFSVHQRCRWRDHERWTAVHDAPQLAATLTGSSPVTERLPYGSLALTASAAESPSSRAWFRLCGAQLRARRNPLLARSAAPRKRGQHDAHGPRPGKRRQDRELTPAPFECPQPRARVRRRCLPRQRA